MKQVAISVALILFLAGPAFGMGWLGGHGGSSQNNTGTAVTSGNDSGTNKSGNTEGGTVTMSGTGSVTSAALNNQSGSVSLPEPSLIILLIAGGAAVFYARKKLKA